MGRASPESQPMADAAAPQGPADDHAEQTYNDFNLQGTSCETTRLTKEGAKQRKQSMRFQRYGAPNRLGSRFAEQLLQMRLSGSISARQDRR